MRALGNKILLSWLGAGLLSLRLSVGWSMSKIWPAVRAQKLRTFYDLVVPGPTFCENRRGRCHKADADFVAVLPCTEQPSAGIGAVDANKRLTDDFLRFAIPDKPSAVTVLVNHLTLRGLLQSCTSVSRGACYRRGG